MIRCSSCNNTFDENRISDICPYCGAEKGLIYEASQHEANNFNTDSKPQYDNTESLVLSVGSILFGFYSIFWPTFVINGIGLFLGIRGVKMFHKNLSVIGIFICSMGLLFNIANYIDDYQERTNLYNITANNFTGISGVTYYGDRESVVVIIDADFVDYRIDESLKNMLQQLGFSSAVVSRMYRTRALDGTQSATGEHANATWTYHPDPGLQIVFESNR